MGLARLLVPIVGTPARRLMLKRRSKTILHTVEQKVGAAAKDIGCPFDRLCGFHFLSRTLLTNQGTTYRQLPRFVGQKAETFGVGNTLCKWH